ncbi:MAG: peptide ABC transporter permease [Chloroflexota bacterium]
MPAVTQNQTEKAIKLRKTLTPAGRAWRTFRRHHLALASAFILALLVLASALAPVISSYDPDAASLNILAPPSPEHPLGTDDVGRDLLSRLLHAGRISLSVGFGAAVLTVVIGVLVGAPAGYYGGRLDALLSGLINVMLAIPILPLALVLSSFVQTNLTFVIFIIGGLSWPAVARIMRAEFLSLREREFVDAARVLGAGSGRIIFIHILPNTLAPIIVAATLQVANAILLESALSFLGYGVQPPQASWGNMLQDAQRYLRTVPELAIYPGALISLTVISINFLGDGLREALDPRLQV